MKRKFFKQRQQAGKGAPKPKGFFVPSVATTELEEWMFQSLKVVPKRTSKSP